MEEAELEKSLKILFQWKRKHHRQGNNVSKKQREGWEKCQKPTWLLVLPFHFTNKEIEAQRSRIIFPMATLLGQKSELGFELLSDSKTHALSSDAALSYDSHLRGGFSWHHSDCLHLFPTPGYRRGWTLGLVLGGDSGSERHPGESWLRVGGRQPSERKRRALWAPWQHKPCLVCDACLMPKTMHGTK